MEHGLTWLSFLPGYQNIEAYLQQHYHGVLGGTVVVQHVFAGFLSALIVLFVAFKVRRDVLKAGDAGIVPEAGISIRNIIEVVAEGLQSQMRQVIGEGSERYFPVVATLGLYIFISNALGLIPGFSPPTDNWNTTFACGIFVFLYYNWHGLRANGLSYLAHMANPVGEPWGWFIAPLMLPIELVGHLARPFSLGVRLATNMVGDHAVLTAFLGLVPILVPLPFLALGLIVCVVQTFVFVLLTMIYISMSVAHAHGDEHHGHEASASAHA
jgi:F-type H+-transporting ATPase subunit a